MSTYLYFGKYDRDSLEKVRAANVAERNRTAEEIVRRCDGRIVSVYATLGEYDIVAVLDLPGAEAAMKVSIELTRALGISFVTTPALSLEAFDRLFE